MRIQCCILIFLVTCSYIISKENIKWKYLYTKKNIHVYKQVLPKTNLTKAKATFQAPNLSLEKIQRIFLNHKAYSQWVHGVDKIKVLKQINKENTLFTDLFLQIKTPIVSDRYYFGRQAYTILKPQKEILFITRHRPKNTYYPHFPIKKNLVEMSYIFQGWRFKKIKESMKITCYVQFHAGGFIRSSFSNWKTPGEAFNVLYGLLKKLKLV